MKPGPYISSLDVCAYVEESDSDDGDHVKLPDLIQDEICNACLGKLSVQLLREKQKLERQKQYIESQTVAVQEHVARQVCERDDELDRLLLELERLQEVDVQNQISDPVTASVSTAVDVDAVTHLSSDVSELKTASVLAALEASKENHIEDLFLNYNTFGSAVRFLLRMSGIDNVNGLRICTEAPQDERAAALLCLCHTVKQLARHVGVSIRHLVDCLPTPLVRIAVPGRGQKVKYQWIQLQLKQKTESAIPIFQRHTGQCHGLSVLAAALVQLLDALMIRKQNRQIGQKLQEKVVDSPLPTENSTKRDDFVLGTGTIATIPAWAFGDSYKPSKEVLTKLSIHVIDAQECRFQQQDCVRLDGKDETPEDDVFSWIIQLLNLALELV